jgi:rhomboid family GlyGly-CTERM serine protease
MHRPSLTAVKNRFKDWPVGTWSVFALAILATAWADANTWAAGEREALKAGEFWRLWSAHVVHFSWSHAGWSGLVWLMAGGLMERTDRKDWSWALLVIAPLITLATLALDPSLARYGGLSGLTTATLVWLGLRWFIRTRGFQRLAGLLVLAGVSWKIAHEWGGDGSTTLAEFGPASGNVRVASWAHVAGALGGAFLMVVHLIRSCTGPNQVNVNK